MAEGGDGLLGSVVDGRYRVLRHIGRGGMGSVFEVEHERIGRRFALKTLHAEYATNANVVSRFQREARAAGMIGNEHIIQVSDMGQLDNGEPYIIMELLEGRELGELLDDLGPLPVARIVSIATQVCDALQSAHDKGIIHRDLKPENIFLTDKDGNSDYVKLLDFGISKFKELSDGFDGGLTGTDVSLGTPYYMSPEQASAAKDVDGRADVYALGVVIFQCLTGRVPFEASSFPALLAKIMVEQPPPMSAFRSGLPQALEEVVLRAMAKDPRGRYATMSEVAAALVPFGAMNDAPVMAKSVDPLGVTHPPKDTGTPEAWETGGRTGPERHRSPMVLIGAAVLVAGMLGAGITLWLTRGDEVAASSAGGPVLPVVVGSAVEIPSSDADGPALVIEEPTAVAELEHAPTQVVDEAPPSPQPEATETPHRSTLRRRVPASTPAEPTTSPMLTPTAMTTSAAGARTIQIRNDRRAETVVELACDTESRTVTVSARGTTGVSLPAADCRVRCRGVGEPRCPLVLGAGQQTLVVR